MTDEIIIAIDQLVKHFPAGRGRFTALQGISLEFRRGEFAGLIGPSGSGKTTLLNIVGSLDAPSEGRVTVLGREVAELTQRQSAALRNYHIGFIFQTYNLLPVFTVFDNVLFALLLQKMSGTARHQAVMAALEWVGLADKAQAKPAQLSGGECQRVSIARAMVKRPELVLADEPSANLDARNSHHIIQTMKRLNRELGTTFLFATHDEKVMRYLDRIITLEDGRVAGDRRQPGDGEQSALAGTVPGSRASLPRESTNPPVTDGQRMAESAAPDRPETLEPPTPGNKNEEDEDARPQAGL